MLQVNQSNEEISGSVGGLTSTGSRGYLTYNDPLTGKESHVRFFYSSLSVTNPYKKVGLNDKVMFKLKDKGGPTGLIAVDVRIITESK